MEDLLTEFSLRATLNHALLQFIAMGVTIFLIPRLSVTNFSGAFVILGALAVVNSTIWDVGLFMGVPNDLTSQTIQIVLVNGAIFWILVKMLPGIETEGLMPAFVAPLVFAIVSASLRAYAHDVDWIGIIGSGIEELMNYRDNVKVGG